MDSPRQGFRRAAFTSWALVGVGIAGVAGATSLAYADTVKPAVEAIPADAANSAPGVLIQTPAEDPPPAPAPEIVTTEAPPPPPLPVPAPTVEQAPVETYTPPEYTPQYTPQYTPEPTVEQQAPAPRSTTPPTTKRRNATPTTVMAPNYSPRITVSRGS